MKRLKKPLFIVNLIVLILAFYYISLKGEGDLTIPLIVLGGLTIFQTIRLVQELKKSEKDSLDIAD